MVSLIPLTISDGETLEQIHKACFPDGWSQDTFQKLLNDKGVCGWMAISPENLPIGFILARILYNEAEILTFAVQPSVQRNGIGRYLLEELLIFIRSVQCNKLYLEVAIDNEPAVSLYKNMGFQIISTRPDYYKRAPNTLVAAYVMVFEYT
jgi:[ribosomal protein S18]-alanine N-acetyltransferase